MAWPSIGWHTRHRPLSDGAIPTPFTTYAYYNTDDNENVWFLLHSGSRGVGNRFGSISSKLTKNAMRQLDNQLGCLTPTAMVTMRTVAGRSSRAWFACSNGEVDSVGFVSVASGVLLVASLIRILVGRDD